MEGVDEAHVTLPAMWANLQAFVNGMALNSVKKLRVLPSL